MESQGERRTAYRGLPMADAAPVPSTAPIELGELASKSVDALRGVGPKTLDGLRTLGIDDLLDLISLPPRRYIDRTREARIADLVEGETALVLGRVGSTSSRRVKGNRVMVMADIADGSGKLRVSFFNQAWRERQLTAGTEAAFFGKVEMFRGARQMTNPVVDLIGTRTGRIVSIYPQSEKAGVSSWDLGELVAQVLRRCRDRGLADPVPPRMLTAHGLVDRWSAYSWVHEPDSMDQQEQGRSRLVYDELLRIQLALVQRKRDLERTSTGIVHAAAAGRLSEQYRRRLAFPLTAAQERVITEIGEDMAAPAPMHRLLQGDVGSGKTVVALSMLLRTIEAGRQAALMAPTEVLAEQHAAGIRRDLAGLIVSDGGTSLFGERELRVALLTNRVAGTERKTLLAELADGSIDLVVGTHALIQEGVRFASLGAVVIDEQHRFGVEQRAALRTTNADGTVPDVLVMTATPIPRTAAMTVYGDLDVSVLDELPPGRTPVATAWARNEVDLERCWELVRAEVADGRQVYVVCPLVEESEKLDVASATDTFEQLAHGELSELRLGLLHGRMTSADKDHTMTRFRERELDVLVATTVIEVGVDVPNATVMVILDADRFGIAQLHQLRGRVGRGAAASHCVLVAGEPSSDGEARIEAMVRTTDGFELAEVDLDLRGEGTIMGERQKGRNDLRLASLRRDREWVERARADAMELVGDGTGLAKHPVLAREVGLFLGAEDEEFLLKS